MVEIGTRNGDGMGCFARIARTALAIEYDAKYCRTLRRCATRLNYTVACSDFRLASLDADVITWWQQSPLTNEGVLQTLRDIQSRGRIRATAEALVVFDRSWRADMASFEGLCGIASWSQEIPFDETSLCQHKMASSHHPSETCARAAGTFILMAVPVERYGLPPRAGWGACPPRLTDRIAAATRSTPTPLLLLLAVAVLVVGAVATRRAIRTARRRLLPLLVARAASGTRVKDSDAAKSEVAGLQLTARFAICYFGLTRSVRLGTYPSHHTYLFGALNASGIGYRTFMHTWDLTGGVQRVWSSSVATPIDYAEHALLAPHHFQRDNQSAFEMTLRTDVRVVNASWDHTLVINTLCELESIRRVSSMVKTSGYRYTHAVFIRPDCVLLNELPILAILRLGQRDIAIPSWGGNEGHNDQFAAMQSGPAEKAWVMRGQDIAALAAKVPHWQAESLVKFALRRHRVRPTFIAFYFFRLRPNGAFHVSQGMETSLSKDIQHLRQVFVRRGLRAAAAPSSPTQPCKAGATAGWWWAGYAACAFSGAVVASALQYRVCGL